MQYVHQIEKTLKEWYGDLPHLPKGFTKWLAENIWWLTIISVVLGAFGALGSLSVLGVGTAYMMYAAPVFGPLIFSVWLWVIAMIVVIVIEAMAISPLKSMQRHGWDLLLLALVIGAAGGIVSDLVRVDLVGILFTLIGFAVGSYVLLEIDQYFGKSPK